MRGFGGGELEHPRQWLGAQWAGLSSGRAWRLWAARHSQEEAGPLGAQPLPRVLELAASKAAQITAWGRLQSRRP